MLTYQDLVRVGENTNERADFIRRAIGEHKSTPAYKMAAIAREYDAHRNVTIGEYQKLLYTVTGKAVPDNWSANYKMASNFFHRFVTQEVQYLLGNGVTWNDKATEGKLSNSKYDFDTQLQKAGKNALVMGESFGFFNLDHLEVFDFLEFVPLYDEENGALSAGIRFWQIAANKPMRATIYEIDGYTEWMWKENAGEIIKEKRPYKLKIRSTEADGSEIYDASNYPTFPIVPLWGNSYHQSEFTGLREQIDCYDLIKSGFANTVDEASIVYWTLTNAGGMDDIDLAKFVERLKTLHAVTLDDQVQVTPNTQEAPYASREALLSRLEEDLYKDAMALRMDEIASGAVTATQIKAAYEPLNSKVDEFEYCVIQFIKGILAVAGIDDDPTFTRSKLVNVTEEIQVILQAGQYLDMEYITRKILTLLGDGDQADDVLKRMDNDDMDRFGTVEPVEEEQEETPEESEIE